MLQKKTASKVNKSVHSTEFSRNKHFSFAFPVFGLSSTLSDIKLSGNKRSRLARVRRENSRRTVATIFAIFIVVPFLFSKVRYVKISPSVEVKSSYSVGVSPTPSPLPRVEIVEYKPIMAAEPEIIPQSAIEKEIHEVFGKYSDKAFLLLKGKGQKSCAENRGLNPNATNDNTKWGGVGIDWGIFQINDHWQGFRHLGKAKQFLLDPHINIRVAWRIFEDEGYSFKLWTCGREYGI